MNKVAFISGPIAPGDDYFHLHYEDRIVDAINAGHHFVIGPAPGIDTVALNFLANRGVELSRITVYLAMFQDSEIFRPRLRFLEDGGGAIKVEGVTTEDRDAAMTRDSDYDILRYMPVAEAKVFYGESYFPRVTQTEKNERRRQGLPLHRNFALEESKTVEKVPKKDFLATLGRIIHGRFKLK